MSRLKDIYKNKVIPELMQNLHRLNPMEVPKITKVVLNMGVGKALDDKSELDRAVQDLTLIAGQRPQKTRAKKSISGFKLRVGNQIGLKLTLRRERMYEFLDKLFNIILPQIRDFQGLTMKSFDGSGNFTIGIEEQTVFPEVDPSKIDRIRGLEITIITSAKNDREAELLLRGLGCPLRKEK